MDFKDTPSQIVISLEHWRMHEIKGQEDQEMTKGIGLLNNQKAKMVILEWWMWWRWLMHSPPIWQTSTEGLKVTTLVANLIRISPQTHVARGWRRVLMHDHLLCPCINISNVKDHRFIYHIMYFFLFIACFFYKFCFVLVFIDLTFLVLFLSVFKKFENHKKLKNLQKIWSLVLCISHVCLA